MSWRKWTDFSLLHHQSDKHLEHILHQLIHTDLDIASIHIVLKYTWDSWAFKKSDYIFQNPPKPCNSEYSLFVAALPKRCPIWHEDFSDAYRESVSVLFGMLVEMAVGTARMITK